MVLIDVLLIIAQALEQDDEMPELWTQVSTEQIQELQRRNQQTALALEKRKKIASGKNGFEVESVGEIFI